MIQCSTMTPENSRSASGGFLPPGRIRSRARSGSSHRNEATKMAAKMAR